MTFVLLLLLVGACGESSSSQQAAVDGTTPLAEDVQADSETGACRLFSEEDAEAALGYAVKLVSTSAFGSIEDCEFEPVGGEQYGDGGLFIRVNQPMDPVASFADTRALAEVDDVAGLGDEAFFYASELWILNGVYEVTVRVDWYGEQNLMVREATIDVAKTVLSRL